MSSLPASHHWRAFLLTLLASILFATCACGEEPEGEGTGEDLSTQELIEQIDAAQRELLRLRREVSKLRIDNDILKKAAIILGTSIPNKHDK